MGPGSWKTLRIDLSTVTTKVEELPPEWVRQFLGGRAFGACLLLREVPPGADPFGPENKLILATGVLTDSKLSGSSRFSALARSPLTGGYGEAEGGGWWGPELNAAGFHAIILEGKAAAPVYIWIHDGRVEIRDAGPIWGHRNKRSYDWLRGQVGRARILQIGPAGENRVRYAHLVNELHHANGRTGMGAVMGSKNVKAIAVSGSNPPQFADPEGLDKIRRWHNEYLLKSFYGKHFREHGTPSGFEYQNLMGALPTRNFRDMVFERADAISSKVLEAEYLKGHTTCYSCVLRCKPVSRIAGDTTVDPALGGPEFETMAALGSLCGIGDMAAIVRANAMASDYGLDSISLGNSIAFAMECYEAGLLSTADTGGLELHFGNAPAMLELIDQIANRRGFGDLLAEGTLRAAKAIGRGAESLANQVKGQEMPMHDPRTKISQALAYAVCPTGADHNTSPFDDMYAKKGGYLKWAGPLGIHATVPEKSLGPEKVRLYTYLHHERSLCNSLLFCIFVGQPMTPFTLPKLTEAVRAATGWDISDWEMLKVGERGTTLARLFNVTQGLTAAEDRLPPRMFEAVPEGPKAGRAVDRREFDDAVQLYYQMMGWNSEGVPTRAKLYELGVGEFAASAAP